MFELFFSLVALIATFVAGAKYGRNAEAKAIAFAIRIESYGDREIMAIRSRLASTVSNELAKIRKFL